jgi:hypothetical protein
MFDARQGAGVRAKQSCAVGFMNTNPVANRCCVPGCGKWSIFGYSRSRSDPITWWCGDHYPHWDLYNPKLEAEAIGEMIAARTTQQS